MDRRAKLGQYGRITLGCWLFAMAVAFCLDPWSLAAGGVSGLAIVLSRWLPMETGTIILLCNLPLLWLGWRRFGGAFLAETAYATVISAIFINILEHLQRWFSMPPLCSRIEWAALVGGVFSAAGIGMIFREGGTTGGTDIVVHLLHDRYGRPAPGLLFLAVDAAVILLAVLSGIGREEAVYAILTLCVFSICFGRFAGRS